MFVIATRYEKGLGLAKDLEQAELWYGRAAVRGNETAELALKRLQGAGSR